LLGCNAAIDPYAVSADAEGGVDEALGFLDADPDEVGAATSARAVSSAGTAPFACHHSPSQIGSDSRCPPLPELVSCRGASAAHPPRRTRAYLKQDFFVCLAVAVADGDVGRALMHSTERKR
jgi:hypothetical protein